jgi:hypothetical protein
MIHFQDVSFDHIGAGPEGHAVGARNCSHASMCYVCAFMLARMFVHARACIEASLCMQVKMLDTRVATGRNCAKNCSSIHVCLSMYMYAHMNS